MEKQLIKCICKDCGTTWNKGEMGDNEEYCFKCVYLSCEDDDRAYPASDDIWDNSY